MDSCPPAFAGAGSAQQHTGVNFRRNGISQVGYFAGRVFRGYGISQGWYFAGMGGFAPATCRELPECTIIVQAVVAGRVTGYDYRTARQIVKND